MEYERLVRLTADLHCFSAGMITAGEDIEQVRVQLSRWAAGGRIIRLHKGWYTLKEPFRRVRVDMSVIACTIKAGSYVSLHSALAYYGMIPEYVAETTCITTGRPQEIDTPFGRIRYRHVKPDAFFGYRQVESGTQHAFVAEPEKALLDLLYFTTGSDDASYLAGLRLQNLETLDSTVMEDMARRFAGPKLMRAVGLTEELVNQETNGVR